MSVTEPGSRPGVPTAGESAAGESAAGESAAGESAWERRRRLDEVFGDVLPATTSDERDPERPGSTRARDGEDPGETWLRSQVPPHHGG